MPYSREFLSLHAFLFVIDPSRLLSNENKQYRAYEAEEPGYGNGILKGYQYAFDPMTNKPMSHMVLQAIHKAAMSHDKTSSPGQYKQRGNHFTLFALPFNDKQVCTQNTSLAGFHEFIASSLVINNPIHSVCFSCPKDNHLLAAELGFSLQSIDGPLKMYSGHQDYVELGRTDLLCGAAIPEPLIYDSQRDNPKIEQALQCSGSSVKLKKVQAEALPFYINSVNATPYDIVPIDTLSTVLLERLDAIFASYAKAIIMADSNEAKLIAIVSHIQQISQLHPFADGNTRVCGILLNRLLKEEHLKLTLPFNPNRFDCFSVHEIVECVKQGQTFCADLLNSKIPTFEEDACYANALRAGLKKHAIIPTPLLADDQAFTDFLNLLQYEQQWLLLQQTEDISHTYSADKARFFPAAAAADQNPIASSLSAKKELLTEVTSYIQTKSVTQQKTCQSFIQAVVQNQLELALRKAAAINEIHLVLFILNHVKKINDSTFNINAPSPSTGKSALELSDSSPIDSLNKRQTMNAIRAFELNNTVCLAPQAGLSLNG